MTDIEVIYDPVKELACIINLDTRLGWGPAFIGPNAGNVLQLWIDSLPFDPTLLTDYQAASVFDDWLQQMAASPAEAASSPPVSPVEPLDGAGLAHDALAQAEAAASGGEPPEPQPADTDVEEDASTPPTVSTCPLCAGARTVVNDETGEVTPCGMCSGTGVVRMAVPS
jgi:hypothetical protein